MIAEARLQRLTLGFHFCNLTSDFCNGLKLFLRELNLQRQRSGNPVRKIRQPDQHMQIHNPLVRKMLLELAEVGITALPVPVR